MEEELQAARIRANQAEIAWLAAQKALRVAEEALKDREAQLVLDPESPVNGKNAEVRAAQLRAATAEERARYLAAESHLADCRLELNIARRDYDTLWAIMRYAPIQR